MRKICFFSILVLLITNSSAQLKTPTMAPILTKGYYVNFKGDTIRGQIQINPPFETEFYRHFYFKVKKTGKPKLMDAQKVRSYGFANRNFVRIDNKGRKEFVERLVSGRLRFYESRYPANLDDPLDVETEFFVKDTGADDNDSELREIKKIYPKFYKKNLKPYMKDQLMIWADLDKYTFNKQTLIKAISEFNKYYSAI